MISFTATSASCIYAIHGQIMMAYLAGAYAVKRYYACYLLPFCFKEFKNLRIIVHKLLAMNYSEFLLYLLTSS
jgi:hypothetical protein